MSTEPEILFEKRGYLGLMTLNRPRALNALTHAMCQAMSAQLEAWAQDDAVQTVAIQGAGERAFCAGGDIRALYDSGMAKTAYALDFWRDEYILNAAIKHYPKPYVALVKGIVMGGGVGVSEHGSHRIADETVIFAMPETGIGMFPDVGGSYFLSRLHGHVGLYLALTGARLTTADCLFAGLADAHVPAANTGALIERLAGGVHPDEAIAGLTADAGLPALIDTAGEIETVFSGASVEDIAAALQGENEDWARNAYAALSAKSPTSMKVAFRQLREGAHLGFDDCMRMEFRIASRILAGKDLFEGVRATIIDKDGAPKWNPARLEDVSDADIERYFAPLDDELPL